MQVHKQLFLVVSFIMMHSMQGALMRPALSRTQGLLMRGQASRLTPQPGVTRSFLHTAERTPLASSSRLNLGQPTMPAQGPLANVGRLNIQRSNPSWFQSQATPVAASSSGWGLGKAALGMLAAYGAGRFLLSPEQAFASEETPENAEIKRIGDLIWDNLRNNELIQQIINGIPQGLAAPIAVNVANFLLKYINDYPRVLSGVMYWYPKNVDTVTAFLVSHPRELADGVPGIAQVVTYLLANGSDTAKALLKQAVQNNQAIIATTTYGNEVLAIPGLIEKMSYELPQLPGFTDDEAGSRLMSSI